MGGHIVCRLEESKQRIAIASLVDIALCLVALESQVPCAHVPTDGHRLVEGQLQTQTQQHDHRFLTMADRHPGIVRLIGVILFPLTLVVLIPFLCFLVDVGLADVMEQGGDDDTLLRQPLLHLRRTKGHLPKSSMPANSLAMPPSTRKLWYRPCLTGISTRRKWLII